MTRRSLINVAIIAVVVASVPVKAQPQPSGDNRDRAEQAGRILFAPAGEVDNDKRLAVAAIEAVAVTPALAKGAPYGLRVYYNRFKVGDRTREDIRATIERLLFPFHLVYLIDPIQTNGIRPLGPPMGTATRDTNGCQIGTLGVAATDAATHKGYITCNHVAAVEGLLLCPNAAKANEVGLSQYPICDPSVSIGKLTGPPPEIKDPPVYNEVDAAFVEERGGGVDATNKCGYCPNGKVVNPTEAEQNHIEIYSCGAATGPMTGNVKLATAVVKLSYGLCGEVGWFSGQIEVDGPFGKGGDSGAVAFDKDGAAVGLVFAGDQVNFTFLNPMGKVLTALGNVTITPCK
jgi:hypothetical protein